MQDKEGLGINASEAPIRIVEENEKRQYFLFREKDPNYPLELIITQIPPGHIQPFHRHEVIDEIVVVLHGEVTGLIKDESGIHEQQIQPVSLYDPESHDFHRIIAADDGTLLLLLEDKETGEIFGGELPLEEGFNAGRKFHTNENRTREWAITAAVKLTTKEALTQNPRIFQEDKIIEPEQAR